MDRRVADVFLADATAALERKKENGSPDLPAVSWPSAGKLVLVWCCEMVSVIRW